MYENLKKFADKKGIAIEKYIEKEVILSNFKDKEKAKSLTTAERFERIEQLLGIV